jgi:uncharacterized protein YkwD
MQVAKHIGVLFITFLLLLVASPSSFAALRTSEASLLEAMNKARAAHGLAPLRADPTLVRAARAHSLDMLRRDYFAHGPFAARMNAFHVAGPVTGENLAWGTGPLGSPAHVVEMWLASPEHRANLLRPGFTRVGVATPVGRFEGSAGVAVVTADFSGS